MVEALPTQFACRSHFVSFCYVADVLPEIAFEDAQDLATSGAAFVDQQPTQVFTFRIHWADVDLVPFLRGLLNGFHGAATFLQESS